MHLLFLQEGLMTLPVKGRLWQALFPLLTTPYFFLCVVKMDLSPHILHCILPIGAYHILPLILCLVSRELTLNSWHYVYFQGL